MIFVSFPEYLRCFFSYILSYNGVSFNMRFWTPPNLIHSIRQFTENRRKQIIEVVQYIEERLKELDEEKEELKKYQQLDKQRRSLQYTIFEKELLDARQKLEEVCPCPLSIHMCAKKPLLSVLLGVHCSCSVHPVLWTVSSCLRIFNLYFERIMS
jgi:hypothetical protein